MLEDVVTHLEELSEVAQAISIFWLLPKHNHNFISAKTFLGALYLPKKNHGFCSTQFNLIKPKVGPMDS